MDNDELKRLGIVFLYGLALGASAMGLISELRWQASAIRHGAGEYNLKTGEWQWKEPTP